MPLSSRAQRVLDWSRSRDGDVSFVVPSGPLEYQLKHPDGQVELSTLDWGEALLTDLAALARTRWDGVAAQRVGERLRAFIETTEAGRAALLALERGDPLIIRAMAAELLALPWGLCLLGSTGRRLADLGAPMLSLAWPGVEPPPQRGGPGGGRALLAWSAAGGAVPAAEHVEAMARAWAAAGLPFEKTRDVVPNASLETLTEALDAGEPPAALHLLAHGGRAGEVSGIWLGDELVSPDRLAALLARHGSTLRLVVLAVCRGADEGALGNPLGSLGLALHRAGIARVVGARAPLTVAGSVTLARRLYAELLGEPCDLEVALARIAGDLTEADRYALTLFAAPGTPADARPVALRPYRGLLPFQSSHRAFFFGRDAEIEKLHTAIAHLGASGAPRLLFVTGASGSGKSSLVLAGVLGRRDDGSVEETQTLVRLREEVTALARRVPDPAIAAAATHLQRAAALGGALVLRPGQDPEPALSRAEGATGPTLLVVDQLEELFTHLTEAARQPLVDRLLALATGQAGVTVLATLRVDLLGRLGELSGPSGSLDRLAMDPRHQVYVAAPDAAALRAMIAEPASKVGLALEPALLERLQGELAGEPGVLPVLSQVMDALWLRREGGALRLEALTALGGVRGALGRHADETLAALDEATRSAARPLLVRLIEPGQGGGPDLRRRVRLRELCSETDSLMEGLIARLVEARLLVRDEVGGEATLELVHEALITGWPALRAWIEADRGWLLQLRQVERWAEDWAAHGALLEERRLGYAEELALQAPRALPGSVVGLIAASRAALDAAHAREEARARALETEARRARDALRMMEARQPEADGLDRARLLLAVEDPAEAPGWVQAMVELLCEPLIVARFGSAEEKVTHARFGPGGIWLAFWDGRIVKVAEDGAETVVREGDGSWGVGYGGALIAFAVDPTRGALAWLEHGHRLHIEGRVHGDFANVFGLSWTRQGRLRVLETVTPTVHEYTAHERVASLRIPCRPDERPEVLSSDGRHVAVRCPRGPHLVDVETGDERPLPGDPKARLALGEGAQDLLSSSDKGEILLWDLRGADPRQLPPAIRLRSAPIDQARDLALHPGDPRRGALTVHVRGLARRWSFDRQRRRGFRLGREALDAVRFQDGRVHAHAQGGRSWVWDRAGQVEDDDWRLPKWDPTVSPQTLFNLLAIRDDDAATAIYTNDRVEIVHQGSAEALKAEVPDVSCAAFLPDGSLIIGCSGFGPRPADRPAFLRLSPSGLEPHALPGHEGASSLAFDAHGGALSSRGSTLRLTRPGWPLLRLDVPEGGVMCVALDRGRVAAGCSDGLLWVWDLPETLDGLRATLDGALRP